MFLVLTLPLGAIAAERQDRVLSTQASDERSTLIPFGNEALGKSEDEIHDRRMIWLTRLAMLITSCVAVGATIFFATESVRDWSFESTVATSTESLAWRDAGA